MAYRQVSESEVRDIRLLKARMENERLPRGTEPARHVKLGPGGLSDVEWTIQLIQMRHGREVEALRTSSTTDAIAAARDAGLLGSLGRRDSLERLGPGHTHPRRQHIGDRAHERCET